MWNRCFQMVIGFVLGLPIALVAIAGLVTAGQKIIHSHDRQQFMVACLDGDFSEGRLRGCDVAYRRYQAVMANDWHPLDVPKP